MTGATFDRWMVASWGRTGSTVLTILLEETLKKSAPGGKVTWVGLLAGQTAPNQPWTVYHSHSLEQFDDSDDCGIVLTLREPAAVSISSILVPRLGYVHVHHEDHVELAQKRLADPSGASRKDYWNEVLSQRQAWLENRQVRLELHDLIEARRQCIEWNEIALSKLNGRGARVLSYVQWQGSLETAARLIGVDPRVKIPNVMRKNPRHWTESVINADEVNEWLRDQAEDDSQRIARWTE